MPDWNPDQYLLFENERTQPSIDLAARIDIKKPASIIDIGCGPGNSTKVLRQKWPEAKIVGLDSSSRMIEKARRDFPDMEWITGDAADFPFQQKYDIVFSNAAVQWMPNHEVILPRLFETVENNGVLAVQVPANNESPLHKSLLTVSSSPKWSRYTTGIEKLITYKSAEYYYGLLSTLSQIFRLWETTYFHVMGSQSALIEWYKGTGMRPFLESLPDESSRAEFEDEVLKGCTKYYPMQRDGNVLYPFKRIFFIAYKRAGIV